MKSFTVPKGIALHVPGEPNKPIVTADGSPHVVTLGEWVSASVLNDARWIRDFAHVNAAFKISEQVTKELVQLEDADYAKLKDCVENPTNGFQGYHPAIFPQFIPFMQAILEAK